MVIVHTIAIFLSDGVRKIMEIYLYYTIFVSPFPGLFFSVYDIWLICVFLVMLNYITQSTVVSSLIDVTCGTIMKTYA